jgi:hypothetical protein
MEWNEVEKLLEEMIQGQQKKVLHCGQRIIPSLTTDDVLQPNDFPELENHPFFRYEEGYLSGLQSVQIALWALKKSKMN